METSEGVSWGVKENDAADVRGDSGVPSRLHSRFPRK